MATKTKNPANTVRISLLVKDEKHLTERANDYVKRHGAKGWTRAENSPIPSGQITRIDILVRY